MCEAAFLMRLPKSSTFLNPESSPPLTSHFSGTGSKAALISLTKTSALAYQPYVNVNCVCPGWIETDMTEQNGAELNNFFLSKICKGRFGKPEEIAKVVRFLCSDEAEFIDGEVLCVDGGFKNL